MALFETMRENTKIILWITVVAFVGLIFLAWGADFATGGPGRRGEEGVMAKINGERIRYQEYADLLTQARLNYEMQTGRRPDEGVDLMLQASTWDNLVDRTLIRQAAEQAGIQVSDREVAIALLNNPPPQFLSADAFQTDGQFDMDKYRSFLADPRTDTRLLEAQHRELVAQDKIRMQVFAGVKVSGAEIRERWLMDNEKVDLAYALLSYFKMLPDAEVDEGELQAYLNAHAEEFELPERVSLDYIRVEKTISREDSADARLEIEEALADYRRGDDFALLVTDYTQAPPSRRGGEEAAWLTRAQISQPEVAEAAFSLAPGEVSEVITSADGFHLLRVEEKTTEDDVEKVKIAEIFIPLEMSIETNLNIRDRLIDLADSARAVGFDEAAQAAGYAIQSTGLFDRGGFIPGLSRVTAAKDFVQRAKVGKLSRPIEAGDAWYLLRLAERQPPRPATLEDVRARVRNAVLLEKRKEVAKGRAQVILDRCRQGTPLEEAAGTDTLAVYNTAQGVTRLGFIRGLGSDPALTGAAFAHGPGLVPYVVEGSQGALVVEVGELTVPNDSLFVAQKPQIEQNLLREKRNRLLSEWLEELRDQAEIEDYRLAVASM